MRLEVLIPKLPIASHCRGLLTRPTPNDNFFAVGKVFVFPKGRNAHVLSDLRLLPVDRKHELIGQQLDGFAKYFSRACFAIGLLELYFGKIELVVFFAKPMGFLDGPAYSILTDGHSNDVADIK